MSYLSPEMAPPEKALLDFLSAAATAEGRPGRLVLGVSGGLDSMALLQAAVRTAPQHGLPLAALHVHHGISRFADDWAAHVVAACEYHAVPCRVLRVALASGASLEARARDARFAAFAEQLLPDDALLLAQHRDDQAETVLFRLLRGAGVTGLGAMKARGHLSLGERGRASLWRPFLGLSRQQLEHYARAEGLEWVNDDSNRDLRHDRNFLRIGIFPGLQSRWPEAGAMLAKAAMRMQEADGLLTDYARQLMPCLQVPENTLPIADLQHLSEAEQRLVLRVWLSQLGLPLPDEQQLRHVQTNVLPAADDASPLLAWPGCELRRYRGKLYAMPPLAGLPPSWRAVWRQGETLALPDGRQLSAIPAGEGLRADIWSAGEVSVRLRQGGERFRPQGSQHRRELKTLMQEAGIPPWQRQRLPLVWVGDELVAVPGLGVAEGWQAVAGQTACDLLLHECGVGNDKDC